MGDREETGRWEEYAKNETGSRGGRRQWEILVKKERSKGSHKKLQYLSAAAEPEQSSSACGEFPDWWKEFPTPEEHYIYADKWH